jgi:hypothetical protein
MPYQKIPGTSVKWRPAAEAFADPKMRLAPNAEGGFTGYREDFGTKLGGAMKYIVPAMMGYGALANSGALGSAAAGGGGANAAIDTSIGGMAGGGSPYFGSAVPAAANATAPLGGLTAGGAAAGAAGASGTSLLGKLGSNALDALTSDGGIGALASLIPLLMARGGNGGGVGNIGESMPQLNRMLDMSVQRAERTDPLHQMVTRLAEQRMPIRARG